MCTVGLKLYNVGFILYRLYKLYHLCFRQIAVHCGQLWPCITMLWALYHTVSHCITLYCTPHCITLLWALYHTAVYCISVLWTLYHFYLARKHENQPCKYLATRPLEEIKFVALWEYMWKNNIFYSTGRLAEEGTTGQMGFRGPSKSTSQSGPTGRKSKLTETRR